MGEQTAKAPGLNRAKTYQLVLFPLNNGATNVYYVLVLSYIATFGSKVLALSMIFASVMVTGMRLFDAITDPIIGALMDRTNGKFGKFRPFMVIGNLIMAASILVLYCLTPLIPASSMFLRYAAFVALYAVWVIGYTFQTSCTRSGQTVLTNDPKQRPLSSPKTMRAATPLPVSSALWLLWASSSPSSSPFWPSSASGRRTSPSTSASAARSARRSSCTSTSRSSRTITPCSV